MYYYDGSQFSVKVTGKNGKIVAGEKVAIKIGSKTYHPVTDKNRIATVSIVNTAGKYDVTSIYKGFNTVNKLTIKPIGNVKYFVG